MPCFRLCQNIKYGKKDNIRKEEWEGLFPLLEYFPPSCHSKKRMKKRKGKIKKWMEIGRADYSRSQELAPLLRNTKFMQTDALARLFASLLLLYGFLIHILIFQSLTVVMGVDPVGTSLYLCFNYYGGKREHKASMYIWSGQG